MTPATAGIRAHLRMLETVPRERIHTHERSYHDRMQGQRVGPVPEALIEEVRALQMEGMTQRSILQRLTMGDRLYRKINRILIGRTSVAERRARIVQLIERGTSERTIASILGISRTSVQNHKRSMATI